MADGAEAGRKLKLGDRVRFTRRMAGFKVPMGDGRGYAKSNDPHDGYRAGDARNRVLELNPDAKYGTYRVVVEWEPRARRDYDLIAFDSGIIVGKTFRYEGQIQFEEGFMSHVSSFNGRGIALRVPCWEVKQTLNRRPVLVPLDAVELIGV